MVRVKVRVRVRVRVRVSFKPALSCQRFGVVFWAPGSLGSKTPPVRPRTQVCPF